MSWSQRSPEEDSVDVLTRRISDLESAISMQLFEIHTELGLAAAAMRAPVLGDLEEQLARAVSVSLASALDAIRVSLAEVVEEAVDQLAGKLQRFASSDVEQVGASLQQAVLLALASWEQSSVPPSTTDPVDGPATARDVARVNSRIDELRELLLG